MLDFLFTAVDDRVIDFETLKLHEKPNQYLVLPEGNFSAEPHQLSPVLSISATELQKQFSNIAQSQKKVEVLRTSDDGLQVDYVQRTPFMGYPDTITVRFYPQGEDTSTLAIYSRSHYGYSDLGANKKRITLWLDNLKASIKDPKKH
ncbi:MULTISPECIES: DUF1499 domain-containing protein [unclassified Endozoicomonas]|uniref:DUF1499 domain-containing protein n=1 Tax=unclassified Endozoicomonas TaxID=2644528 RepID=UPI002148AE3F|nr:MULTISPECIES: DUF1499 domain-containing protein [unclassified Endozoicomonas]